MIAYKAFRKGLVCRGYKFSFGVNRCEEANCVKNGFHCAENPIDCLTYYPDIKTSEYCIVDALGDMDEDACDSKISCTELHILKRLSLKSYFYHCLFWLALHPESGMKHCARDYGECYSGYTIVVGKDPVAKGKEKGDILALLQVNSKGSAVGMAVHVVGQKNIEAGKYYDLKGKVRRFV